MEQQFKRRLIPVSRWNHFHPWPTQAGLRYLIFHANKNGFHKVVRRNGRRVLIDEQAFFKWIDDCNSCLEGR